MENKRVAGKRRNGSKAGICCQEQDECKRISEGSANGVMLVRGPYDKVTLEALQFASDPMCAIIDAADVFNPLNTVGSDPNIVAAPVTAFQLKKFVDEELSKHKDCSVLVVLSLKNLFFDSNMLEEEYLSVFSEIVSKIRRFSKRECVSVVNFEFAEQFEHARNEDLDKMLEIGADWIVTLAPEVEIREVVPNKHD